PSRTPEFLGSGAGAFTEVVDRVVRGGHGSAASVTTYERGADRGHEWEVVNDHGVVSLVDAQAGTTRPATPDALPAGTDRLYAVPLDANGDFIGGEPPTPPPAPAELGADVVARHGEAVSSTGPDWSSYLDFLEARIQASRDAIELLGPDRAVVERERLAGLVLHHREVDVHRMRLEVAAGGEVIEEPHDVADLVRTALVVDPTGARFGLWQGREHPGCRLVNEPGALVRNDLVTAEPAAARAFYRAVFDFTLDGNDDLPDWDFTFLRRPDGHE
ncbi:hypothetical protein K7G98_31465, partial [Saccharothrix sp. MB29]|nr:hypothetical protein [Saccharothrix sp. MB29]